MICAELTGDCVSVFWLAVHQDFFEPKMRVLQCTGLRCVVIFSEKQGVVLKFEECCRNW